MPHQPKSNEPVSYDGEICPGCKHCSLEHLPAEPVSDKKWAKLKIEMGPLPDEPMPLSAQEEKAWWKKMPFGYYSTEKCADGSTLGYWTYDIPAIIHEAEAKLLEKVMGMMKSKQENFAFDEMEGASLVVDILEDLISRLQALAEEKK